MSPNCAPLISTVEFDFLEISLPYLKFSCTSSQNQSSDRICSGFLDADTKYQLNLCKAQDIEILPIYSEATFREKIRISWIKIRNFGPLLVPNRGVGTQIQLKQQRPYVVEWNNSDCLLAEVSYWDVQVYDNSTGDRFGPYYRKLSDKCSRNASYGAGGKSQGFRHSVVLPTEPVPSSCAVPYLQGGKWELSSCSSYMVKVTPETSSRIFEELSLRVEYVTPFKSDCM